MLRRVPRPPSRSTKSLTQAGNERLTRAIPSHQTVCCSTADGVPGEARLLRDQFEFLPQLTTRWIASSPLTLVATMRLCRSDCEARMRPRSRRRHVVPSRDMGDLWGLRGEQGPFAARGAASVPHPQPRSLDSHGHTRPTNRRWALLVHRSSANGTLSRACERVAIVAGASRISRRGLPRRLARFRAGG
jgi:hypothetical protein